MSAIYQYPNIFLVWKHCTHLSFYFADRIFARASERSSNAASNYEEKPPVTINVYCSHFLTLPNV